MPKTPTSRYGFVQSEEFWYLWGPFSLAKEEFYWPEPCSAECFLALQAATFDTKQASVISQVAQMPASCKPSPLEHSQRHFKHSPSTTTPCPKAKANMPVTCLAASHLFLFSSFLSFSILCHFTVRWIICMVPKMCRWIRWLPEMGQASAKELRKEK